MNGSLSVGSGPEAQDPDRRVQRPGAGPLLRMKQGRKLTVEVRNSSADPEIVHWHGLFLPSAIDGAMEEGTPMIAPGATTRYSFTPGPVGKAKDSKDRGDGIHSW